MGAVCARDGRSILRVGCGQLRRWVLRGAYAAGKYEDAGEYAQIVCRGADATSHVRGLMVVRSCSGRWGAAKPPEQ